VASIKQHHDAQVSMVEGKGGVFEVSLEDELIFSKKAEGRFPEDSEVLALIASRS